MIKDNTIMEKPIEVSNGEIAFGGRMGKLLPAWEDIPYEFRRFNLKWNELVEKWFFTGLPSGTKFVPKKGIDKSMMIRHLKAILSSFEPKHEHKIAGCAYLLFQWCDNVIILQGAKSNDKR